MDPKEKDLPRKVEVGVNNHVDVPDSLKHLPQHNRAFRLEAESNR